MIDRREQLLARLVVVAKKVGGVSVFRNRDAIPENERPAICILDASEEASSKAIDIGLRNKGVNIVTLMPEIYILATSESETIGNSINSIRMKLYKAFHQDAEILTICGTNGRVDYLGCETQFAQGRKMNGDMSVKFSFSYPMLQSEL